MFSIINNASLSNQSDVFIPTSKKNLRILMVLYKEGVIRGFIINKKKIKVQIKYTTGGVIKPVIKNIKMISTNGRLIFVSVKVLSKLAHHNEILIISTNKGILSAKEALQLNVGGIVLAKIF
jgi:small subunit ribosomal protein S8